MAATLTQERFTSPDWIFERKYDGVRLLAYKQGDRRPPVLAQPPAAEPSRRSRRRSPGLPVRDLVLDGEVTWGGAGVSYHVFDVMWLDGRDVMPLPSRRVARSSIGCALDASDASSDGARRREAVGARMPRGMGRRHRQAARLALRAAALAALAEDEMRGGAGARRRRVHRSAGHRASASARCSSATTRETTSSLPARSAPVSIRSCCSTFAPGSTRSRSPTPPFTKAKGLPRLRAHWVRPEIVVQVAFIEWTVHGKLRHPRLLGRPRTTRRRATSSGRAIVITHPEKVLFPDDGITKGRARGVLRGDRAAHAAAHPRRPVTMERFPAGIGKKGFLQKDVSKGFPEWLERVEVPKKDGTVHHPLVTDTRSLLWIANQNRITPHVWTSRAPDLYQPGRLRLRSRSVGRRRAGRAARGRAGAARSARRARPAKLGEDVGLEGIPHRRLARRQARHRRRRALRASRSGRFSSRGIRSTSRRSSARPIAADASSSIPGATATARRLPPCTRCAPKPGAPVSAPCTWDEIERGDVGPQTFTLRTMAARIAEVGDLWSDMRRRKRSLRRTVEKLEKLRKKEGPHQP